MAVFVAVHAENQETVITKWIQRKCLQVLSS